MEVQLFKTGRLLYLLGPICLFISQCAAFLNVTETPEAIILSNGRLHVAVNKKVGVVDSLYLDGQNLLGVTNHAAHTGIGPYLDCYCVPSGAYTPGSKSAKLTVLEGVDAGQVPYAGVVMSEKYPSTGQVLEQYLFLRESETGLHTFSRLVYQNKTTPFLRNLQEFRVLFRPNSTLWTHLLTNANVYAPLPSAKGVKNEKMVQDATWYLGGTPEDPYVQQFSDYFTKYTFADAWRDHDVHGIYSDGTTSDDNSTFGAWLVMNTKDTYFGGPLHSDLMVDGIVYNYLVSNHHGAGVPNITDGFDRTFGPQYYHFNKGSKNTTMEELRQDALRFYSPTWNQEFYDSIAKHVPNYVGSVNRTTWKGHIDLPKNARRPIAVLAQNKVDFQDNAEDVTALQYWAEVDTETGNVEIPAVKAGTYRLTVYADGIFGQYTKDDVEVVAGQVRTTHARWREESAGTELWRIGTPDKSAGEYRHGYEPDSTHPLQPPQYRIYWAVYDFPTDFPDGVNFKVGESREAHDFNYIHWSVFGGDANSIRTQPYYENVNNWTIRWDMEKQAFEHKRAATLTVQLAGAKTAAGNTDVYNSSEPFSNLPYTVAINGKELQPWIIPYYQSSSCGVRSGISCYNLGNKFTFNPEYFIEGTNEMILSLKQNATGNETAVLPVAVYVQYDALRLEVV